MLIRSLFILLILLPKVSHAAPPSVCESIRARLEREPGTKLKLVVGLGNTGTPFGATRHNAGFMMLDSLIRSRQAAGAPAPDFRATEDVALRYSDDGVSRTVNDRLTFSTDRPVHRNDLGEIYVAERPGEIVLFVKPFADINLSGEMVGELFKFFPKLTGNDLVVLHDELNLDPGVMKAKAGGSPGGHNGIKSIDAALSEKDRNYVRIKFGIGRPKDGGQIPGHVLGAFTPEERIDLADATTLVGAQLDSLLDGQYAKAAGAINAFKGKHAAESKARVCSMGNL